MKMQSTLTYDVRTDSPEAILVAHKATEVANLLDSLEENLDGSELLKMAYVAQEADCLDLMEVTPEIQEYLDMCEEGRLFLQTHESILRKISISNKKTMEALRKVSSVPRSIDDFILRRGLEPSPILESLPFRKEYKCDYSEEWLPLTEGLSKGGDPGLPSHKFRRISHED